MQPISLLVTYTMRPGMAQAFVADIQRQGIWDKIRQEDGCVRYEYALPCQGEDKLYLFESWASLEHQRIHMTQPHMAALSQTKERYALDTTVEYFQPLTV
jgi:quinol monooxygenase YgiN